jgi:putative GTP pyrophosphokinase
METDFDSEYARAALLLTPLGAKVEGLIQDLIHGHDLRIHSVVSRVKTKESCLRKMQKADADQARPLSSLTDVLGLRIITYLSDDVNAVARIIEGEFLIDEVNSVDKHAVLDPDRFGYLSVHYIAQISQTRAPLPEYREYRNVKFEIQIRSILQHAWAEIEHDLGYKSEAAVPRPARRRFSRLASLLELADDEFIAIRDELKTHQEISRSVISRGNLDVEIDQDTLLSFVESDARIKDLDLLLARGMGRPCRDRASRSYIGARVERLQSAGFKTIADLSDFLDQNEALLRAFFADWPQILDEAWKPMEVAEVPRGVSLFLLRMLRLALRDRAGELPEAEVADAVELDMARRHLRSALSRIGNGQPG